MAERPSHPLSPEEAKLKLRAVAERTSPIYWVQKRPAQMLLMAMCCGFLVGRMRLSPTFAMTVTQRLLPVFVGHLIKKKRACHSR